MMGPWWGNDLEVIGIRLTALDLDHLVDGLDGDGLAVEENGAPVGRERLLEDVGDVVDRAGRAPGHLRVVPRHHAGHAGEGHAAHVEANGRIGALDVDRDRPEARGRGKVQVRIARQESVSALAAAPRDDKAVGPAADMSGQAREGPERAPVAVGEGGEIAVQDRRLRKGL